MEENNKNETEYLKLKYEHEESAWLIPRAYDGIELYTDNSGFLGLFPMDILHTMSKGIVDLLVEIVYAYINQTESVGVRRKGSKNQKRRKKSERMLGKYYL